MREGWKQKTIGDVCDVVNGGTPKTGVPEYWDGSYQWITPAEMGRRASPYIQQTERAITDEGLRNSSARLLPPYSVILSSRAPIGYLLINTVPMASNQGCKGLVPHKELDHKFLYYYLTSIVRLLNDLGSGATFKELSGGKLKEILVPIPPLPEQRRILTILDEAFEGIATAKANAEKNLQNAREVFESHLNAVFSQRGEGWVEKRLGEVCTFENGDRGINYPSRSVRTSEGIPFINAGHLTDYGIDYDQMDYISEERFSLLSNGKIKPGDLLFCLRGSLGKFSSVGQLEKGAIASSLVIIRPQNMVTGSFVEAYFKSDLCSSMISSYKNGAAQPNLSAGSLSQFIIPIPPLYAQFEIEKKLAAMLKKIRHLESIYQQKLTALDELKQSLLHQAFNGNL